jgi:hypothetical protein
MASHNKDVGDFVNDVIEDLGWKLEEGIETWLNTITDSFCDFLDSLSDKTLHALEENFALKEKERAARNAGRGTVSPASPRFLKKGDVVFARRMMYRHYGIYAGKKKVIHYAKKESHVRRETAIEETSIQEFSKGDPVYVIKFPKNLDRLYSPGETVKRAKSRTGSTDYNLVFNNCEHFAYWCRTGKHESSQVKDVCEKLFNRRFELDELRDEITEKAWDIVCGILEGITDKLGDLIESLPGGWIKRH